MGQTQGAGAELDAIQAGMDAAIADNGTVTELLVVVGIMAALAAIGKL